MAEPIQGLNLVPVFFQDDGCTKRTFLRPYDYLLAEPYEEHFFILRNGAFLWCLLENEISQTWCPRLQDMTAPERYAKFIAVHFGLTLDQPQMTADRYWSWKLMGYR
jgi:hypothetical protein